MRALAFVTRSLSILTVVFVTGCSGSVAPDGGTDANHADAASDVTTVDRVDVLTDATTDVPAMDAPAMDVPSSDVPVNDVPAVDVPPSDTAADGANSCDPATPCQPYFCGCGRCDPSAIICVNDGRSCPLACPISCPELATTVCECAGGTCAVSHSDGGTPVDAGGSIGTPCSGDSECGTGLLCCYPCGIPGCMNQCMAPVDGMCPLIP